MKFSIVPRVIGVVCALAWTMVPMRAQDGAIPAPGSGEVLSGSSSDAETSTPADGDETAGATFQTFYDALASQGTWVESGDYGYVWQPNVTDADWAPYTVGHWVYTDDGWTWASDEPWGWATYHYGRWVNLDGTGWCWVPGYTWAPAWVSWRYGDGYCGWAPLPPDSFLGIDYLGDGYAADAGFHIGGDCDSFYGIGAGWYNFVPVTDLGYRSYRGYYARRVDNFSIIDHTTNVTNIVVARNEGNSAFVGAGRRVTTGGPLLAQVNAIAQTPVAQVQLVRTTPAGAGATRDGVLAVYAPRVSPVVLPGARPAVVAGVLARASINRGVEVTRPLAVNARLRPSAPMANEIEQAQRAQAEAPERAKIVTAKTELAPILAVPLGALKPAVTAPATVVSRPANAVPDTQRVPGPNPAPGHSYGYPGGGNGPNGVYRSVVVPSAGPAASETYVRPGVPSLAQPYGRPVPIIPPQGGAGSYPSPAGAGSASGHGASSGANEAPKRNH